MRAADSALYQAKHTGRARCVLASSTDWQAQAPVNGIRKPTTLKPLWRPAPPTSEAFRARGRQRWRGTRARIAARVAHFPWPPSPVLTSDCRAFLGFGWRALQNTRTHEYRSSMKIGIPSGKSAPGERRVAATPETVSRLHEAGLRGFDRDASGRWRSLSGDAEFLSTRSARPSLRAPEGSGSKPRSMLTVQPPEQNLVRHARGGATA